MMTRKMAIENKLGLNDWIELKAKIIKYDRVIKDCSNRRYKIWLLEQKKILEDSLNDNWN